MKRHKVLLTIATVITLIAILAFPLSAEAVVARLDYKYGHNIYDHTITKVRGSFEVNMWVAQDTNLLWVVEGDYMSVGEAIFAYYPPLSDTGWIIGFANTSGILKAYVEADPDLSYQYLMVTVAPGTVYFKVSTGGVMVLEWIGASGNMDFFTIAHTSNEDLRFADPEGKFMAIVTHHFLWVYDSNTSSWLKAYDVYYGKSPDYQAKTYDNTELSLYHTRTNFYNDQCIILASY